MKKFFLPAAALILFTAVIALLNSYYYESFETSLREGVYLQADNQDLSAPNWSVPVVYDWNDDGKKDLLVGRHYRERGSSRKSRGSVTYYENTGTDARPEFDSSYDIQTCTLQCSPIDVASSG